MTTATASNIPTVGVLSSVTVTRTVEIVRVREKDGTLIYFVDVRNNDDIVSTRQFERLAEAEAYAAAKLA